MTKPNRGVGSGAMLLVILLAGCGEPLAFAPEGSDETVIAARP